MPDGRLYQQVQELINKQERTTEEQKLLEELQEELEKRKLDLSAFYSLEEIATLFN